MCTISTSSTFHYYTCNKQGRDRAGCKQCPPYVNACCNLQIVVQSGWDSRPKGYDRTRKVICNCLERYLGRDVFNRMFYGVRADVGRDGRVSLVSKRKNNDI